MANNTAFKALYAMLAQALTRTGVSIGSTAGYPRVEINSIQETERLDKADVLRKMTCSIDSMTTDSLLAAHVLNDANLTRIGALLGTTSKGYRVDGVLFTNLQQTTETADSQNIIYRIQQSVDIYLTRTGEETTTESN